MALTMNLTNVQREAPTFKTATGEIVTLTDAKGEQYFRELQTTIELVQDLHGYDYPWPAGGGKNKAEGIIRNCNINASGALVENGTYDMAYGKVSQGTTYTITAGSGLVGGFYTSVPSIGSVAYNSERVVQESATFTAPITGYVAFRCVAGYTTYQLEEGTTATSYAPYSNECPISGWSEAKIYVQETVDPAVPPDAVIDLDGTRYGGTLDVRRGKLRVDRVMIDLSDKTFILYTNQYKRRFEISIPNSPFVRTNVPSPDALCSHFKNNNSQNSQPFGAFSLVTVQNGTAYLTFYDSNEVMATANDFNSYITEQREAGTPVTVVATVDSPIEVDVDPEAIKTVDGINNIWADCGDIEVTYKVE